MVEIRIHYFLFENNSVYALICWLVKVKEPLAMQDNSVFLIQSYLFESMLTWDTSNAGFIEVPVKEILC